MTEIKIAPKATGLEFQIPTQLVTEAGLLPWQVKHLTANVASELQFHSVFETPEKDRDFQKYRLTIHEQEGERWLGLVNDAKRFFADRIDFEALGWPADYPKQPTLKIKISGEAVSGPVVFANSFVDRKYLDKTPAIVQLLLETYINREKERPQGPDMSENEDLDSFMRGRYREYLQKIDEIDKKIYKSLYYKIGEAAK